MLVGLKTSSCLMPVMLKQQKSDSALVYVALIVPVLNVLFLFRVHFSVDSEGLKINRRNSTFASFSSFS